MIFLLEWVFKTFKCTFYLVWEKGLKTVLQKFNNQHQIFLYSNVGKMYSQ